MAAISPGRKKRADFTCPLCASDYISPLLKNKPTSGMWWCRECHNAFFVHTAIEDVIDPHGRI